MTWQSKSAAIAVAIIAMSLHSSSVQAMPEQGKIVAGEGEIARPDEKTMVINQKTDRLALDWQKFNIAKDEKVHFDQNSKSAIALNRVVGDGRSIIDGSLSAKGHVFVINPNGVLFGKNSSVNVGGLVASTANVTDEDMRNFAQGKGDLGLQIAAGREASVINAGTIKAEGGLVALHATNVENTGTIANEGGQTVLAAAKDLNLAADTAGKLNFTVNGSLANAKALNSGTLQNDGGYLVMTAKSAGDLMSTVVNNTGVIEAKTLHANDKGEILLDGGESGQVEVSGTLDASGKEVGQSAGSIKVIGQKTVVNDGTNLLARGAIDGGKIETSGDVLNLGDNLNIDAKGVNGKAGEWLLDPLEILIQDAQPTQGSMDQTVRTVNEGSGTQITYNDPPSATQNADSTYDSTSWIKTDLITAILNKGTDVTIQAASTSQAASITVNSAIKPKVEGDREATLTLEAQRNITINNEIKADANGGKLNVKLNSDTDGDGVGAVIINADISTNGGTFTSGSGGNVKFDATQKDTKGNTIYENKVDAFGNKVPKYLTAGYSSGGTYSGTANIQGNTVGTYFGYVTPAGETVTEVSENRNITTNGGDINLYGEVAIGLNGGTLNLDTSKLNLDTSKPDGAGTDGALNITGIINSGNSYTDYIYGTDAWNKLVSTLVDEYITAGTVPSYHFVGIYYTKNADGTYSYTTTPHDFKSGKTHYAFHEFKSGDVVGSNWTYNDTDGTLDTQDTRWYTTTTAGTGYNSFIMEATTPTTSKMSIDDWLIYYRRTDPSNYATKYADGNTNTKTNLVNYAQIKDNETKMANLKSDISALLAHNWYASEALAKSGTGANPGDSYLATITTALENSLSTPNSQKTLWAGGMGSGVRNKDNDKIRIFTHTPADPTHPDGFYWVTGPEGLVTNAITYTKSDGTTVPVQGTKFWDTSSSDWKKNNYGSQAYGYTKWSSWSGGSQPDNSAPFLTVGYGNNNAWDDASVGGESTVGFVQETNLYNSSLNIKTSGGSATLQGDIGKSVGLDTVKIDAGSGSVTTGNTQNTATKYNNGTIYADHGVYINGGEVTVGGEIHSGGTNVEATRNADASFKDYLDNVTIQSSGNLTVHGIEVNTSTDPSGNTTSRTDGEGGKIKLTSTGTEGVITLGDGVDYNGKNTNGGVLKAASTANDAVVIDAQGKKSKFVNETTSTKAIDTQGKWKIYSASPEQNTFGKKKNLNSETDAQWTSDSTKFAANGSDENKFIFQTTPTITLYVEDKVKTYGDDVTKQLPDYMMNREEFTGVDGTLHNVNEFTDAFQEKPYTNYISVPEGQSITVTSVGKDGANGAVGTATRTGGNHTATEKSGADGKNAVYDLNVNLNGATAKDGYVLKSENATLEILKRKASITGTGTQTYGGEKGKFDWKETKQENIAQGNTVFYTTSVKSGSAYTDNQKGRNTADSGTYENSVSFDSLKIKDANGNEVNIADNYDLTTTGTIDVAKAKLIVNTDGKTTTYGTVDESYTSRLDDSTKALNGDDAKKLISDLRLTYKTDAYQDNDGNGTYDRTNHVKYTSDGKDYDSYKLDVANTNTLNNYEVTVKDSTVTLERAKATVDTDKVTTDYGTVKNTYTSHFNTAVNGDNGDDLLKQLKLSYSTDAYKDADHTNNVKDGGYDLNVKANGSLTYNDYDVKVNDSNVTLNKVNLTVNPEDIHRIYGQATEVQEDAKTAYNLSGFANGDTKDTVDATNKDGKNIDQLVTVTNDVSKALKDEKTHTQNASTVGYDMGTTAIGDLTNYNIVIGDPKKVYLDKAKLTVSVNDTSTTYGSDKWTPYTYTLEGNTNGDKVDDVKNKQISVTYTNGGVKSDASNDAVKTQAAGEYALTGKFTLNGDTATNYEIDSDKSKLTGKATVNKADLTLTLKDVSTTYGNDFDSKTYGYKKDEADLQGLTNGDAATAITDVLKDSDFTYGNGGAKSDPNNENVKTQNAGSYQITGSTSKTLDNYNIKVVNPGTSTVEKAKLTLTVGDVSTVYGTGFDKTKYTYTISGNANGDSDETLKNNQISVTYTNTGEKTDANNDKVKTQDVGDWKLIGNFTVAGNTANNYDVTYVDGTSTVTPAEIHLKLNDVSTTYGTAFTDTNTYGYDASKLAMANGDSTDVVTKAIGNGDITYTNTGDATDPDKIAKGAKTQDAGTGYQLTGTTEKTLKNYKVFIDGADATINKATLKLKVGDYTEAYGAADKVGADLKQTEVTGEQNGDDLADLVSEIGIHNTSGALLSDTRTNDVKYKTDGSLDSYRIDTQLDKDTLKNYNLELSEGTMTLTPVAITVDNEMIQTYGSADRSFKEIVTPPLVNGDTISIDGLTMTPKANGAYEKNRDGRTTADAGKYENDLESDGGGIVHENGSDARKNYSVTIKGDIIVKPAPLTIKTDDVTIDYGTAYKTTVGKTVSSVTGLTNGDAEKASDLSYNYGNYGGGYIENNTKTNHVGGYDFKTTVSNKSEDFLKNYTISGGDARLTINPKDVYFHVDGNGNTLGDVVYTVTDPNNPSSPDPINGQLVYGETVTPSYMPDGRLPNGHYGVSTSLPGYGPIDSGKVYGNYRYHYDGDITVNLPSKPDIVPPVNPPVTPGTGTVTPLPETPENTSNTPENTTETTGHKTVWDGDRDRGGDRPEDKRVVTLPFFKVLEDKTTHRYGTYDVAKRTTEVKIAPSAQVLPEPNQPATQYRELDTELTTDKGTGEFTLKYNGSRFTILPDDDAATHLIVVGDETKNRDLFEKALHVAFTKMGLEVADLDGVYIHFGKE